MVQQGSFLITSHLSNSAQSSTLDSGPLHLSTAVQQPVPKTSQNIPKPPHFKNLFGDVSQFWEMFHDIWVNVNDLFLSFSSLWGIFLGLKESVSGHPWSPDADALRRGTAALILGKTGFQEAYWGVGWHSRSYIYMCIILYIHAYGWSKFHPPGSRGWGLPRSSKHPK
jgi:hypothetical protein